ncbi:hypothetical protein ACHAXS_003316 [Conticribra weissflogii]
MDRSSTGTQVSFLCSRKSSFTPLSQMNEHCEISIQHIRNIVFMAF